MKYQILQSADPHELAQKVEQLADKEGWRPVGGVATYYTTERDRYDNLHTNWWFIQAVMLEGG